MTKVFVQQLLALPGSAKKFSWEDYFVAKSGQGGKLIVWADYQNKGTDQKTDWENKKTCQREAISKEEETC